MSEAEVEKFTNDVINWFNQAYYFNLQRTWFNTFWHGIPIHKCPTDLWIYQEILHDTKPDLIIETGTAKGGSALYLAQTSESIHPVRVVTVDINNESLLQMLPQHPRITYLSGSSTDPQIVTQINSHIHPTERTMVILDSDHAKNHVRAELDLYAPLVTPGCYLIVEDTNVNGHPVYPLHGPGPMEAVLEWHPTHPEFTRDPTREKFMLTFNPNGYFRRR